MQDKSPTPTAMPAFGMRGGPPGSRMMGEKPQLNNVKGTIKRILSYLYAKKLVIFWVFFCCIITTMVNIIGTRMNGYIIDNYIARKDIYMLGIVCVVVAGIYMLGVVSNYIQNILIIRAAQQTSAEIRRDVFAKVQQLPLAYIDTHSSGDLMSRLTNDVDNINNAMSQTVIQLFSSVVSIAGMFIAMCLLSPVLTLVCLLMTPITFFMSRGIAKASQRYFIIRQRDLGSLNGYTEEMISGLKVIKQFSKEEMVEKRFYQLNQRFVANSFKAQAVSGVIGPCNNLINNLSYMLVSVLGGICVVRGINGITVGVVFSFLLYMRNFTNPINNILNLLNSLQLALASAERVFNLIDEAPEMDKAGAVEVSAINGAVEINQVDFSYITGKPVLKGATIAAEPGQVIAIVGPTGAGKTTIINLLTRFYDVDSGEILLDGVNIENYTRKSLRQSVALVLQDMFLFSDTIRENIRFGRISATDAEVEEAAKGAFAHEFIVQLPEGYDTVLADNGQNLSQGQRQLLSIARAIISHASILILDEATSSIDTHTEVKVQKALLALMKGKTSFVIAHRLSTIKNADGILVVDDGQVIERGTHEELLAADGFYARLYNSQFKGK